MPNYDYSCPKCGTFETFQKMSDDSLTECPTCESSVKKIFTTPGIVGMPNGPKDTSPVYRSDRSAIWNSAQAQ